MPLDWRGELLKLREGQSVGEYVLELVQNGRIFVGAEGDEYMLAAAIRKVGNGPFMFSSDFPHEVNTEKCLHHLEEIFEHAELSADDRDAILFRNAERFYAVRADEAGREAAE